MGLHLPLHFCLGRPLQVGGLPPAVTGPASFPPSPEACYTNRCLYASQAVCFLSGLPQSTHSSQSWVLLRWLLQRNSRHSWAHRSSPEHRVSFHRVDRVISAQSQASPAAQHPRSSTAPSAPNSWAPDAGFWASPEADRVAWSSVGRLLSLSSRDPSLCRVQQGPRSLWQSVLSPACATGYLLGRALVLFAVCRYYRWCCCGPSVCLLGELTSRFCWIEM